MKCAASAAVLTFHLLQSALLHAYKVASPPDPLCNEDVECEDLVKSWGCAGTWRLKCGNMEHPLGPSSLDTAVAHLCPLDCPDGVGKPKAEEVIEVEMAEASGALPISEAKKAEAKGIAKCLIEEGMKTTEDLVRQREILAVANAEWASMAEPIPDNQTAMSVEMHGREAAHHIIQDEFEEEEEALQKLQLAKEGVEKFGQAVEKVARSCNNPEAEALKKMATDAREVRENHDQPSPEAAILVDDLADTAMEKCKDETLDLDYFVEHVTLKEGAHCGSSFLQEKHLEKAHRHLKELEFHAKAALVLHNNSHPLGHHVAGHLQKHLDHEGHEDGRPSFFMKPFVSLLHEAARAPLSQKHLERLHRLDDRHYVELHGDTRDAHCQERVETARDDPNHWSLHHQDIKAYVDCICTERKPSLVCQAVHAEGMAQVQKEVEDKLAELHEAAKSMPEPPLGEDHELFSEHLSELQTYSNHSVQFGTQRAIPIGPCDEPLSCTVCTEGVCMNAPFSVGVDDTSPSGYFNVAKNVLNVISQGLEHPKPPCFSVSCTACVGLKPGDFFKVILTVGASTSCGGWGVFFSSFKVSIGLSLCLSAGPIDKVLELLKKSQVCMGLPSLSYYPFVGKMGLSYHWQPWWLAKAVEMFLETTWPVHGVARAVHHHCWFHPAQQTNNWLMVWTYNRYKKWLGHSSACNALGNIVVGCPWSQHDGQRVCKNGFMQNRRMISIRVKTLSWKLSMKTRFYKEWTR